MDVKKLARIPDGGGWKAFGRGHGNRDRTSRTGFDFVHSLIDDHSRFNYSEVLPDEKGPTCTGFPERALAEFAAHNITVEELMTDNAWAYKWSLREVCAAHSIRQIFIKPQNGKVERLNRTLLTEWAYRRVFISNQERADALAPWLEHYNNQRRHSALGGLPPVSRLLPT
jgi:transposase InsO family protein